MGQKNKSFEIVILNPLVVYVPHSVTIQASSEEVAKEIAIKSLPINMDKILAETIAFIEKATRASFTKRITKERVSGRDGKIWDFDSCKADALLYKSKMEWCYASPSAFHKATKNGWKDVCCEHMKPSRIRWTLELCIADAKKYENRTRWFKNSQKGYAAAKRYGWLDLCFPPTK